jgi:ferredoxin
MSSSGCIKVDYDKCVGSRICVAIAPKVFKLNSDGQAAVADAAGDDRATIQTAIEACPVSAISFEPADKSLKKQET